MANYKERIREIAKLSKATIVLPETDDNRIKSAIPLIRKLGIEVSPLMNSSENYEKYIEYLSRLKFTKNWPLDEIKKCLDNPLNLGIVMVACGDADGLVAGANTTTSDVIRSAIRIVGVQQNSKWVSSIFFMISPDGERAYTFTDCGVIPEPTSEQLVTIAKDASEFHQLLSGDDSRVAFLSFSTKGSASHYRVDRVQDAVRIFGNKFGHIPFDGELQFDAAIDSSIASKKAPNSPLNGDANVMVFPNLDSGNIAYKITEKLANYTAWGPLLQGLNKPVHDLSRGCSIDDIVNVACITALQKDAYANI